MVREGGQKLTSSTISALEKVSSVREGDRKTPNDHTE